MVISKRGTIAICLALLVVGCGSSENPEQGVGELPPPTFGQQPQADAPDPAAAAAEEPLVSEMGQSISFPNGLQVAVSQPSPYAPNPDSDPRKAGWGVNIAITNGTNKATVDTSQVTYSASRGGRECEEIWDYRTLNGAPSTPTLRGKQTVFPIAFTCPNAKSGEDIVLNVETGTYDADDYEWTGVFSGVAP